MTTNSLTVTLDQLIIRLQTNRPDVVTIWEAMFAAHLHADETNAAALLTVTIADEVSLPPRAEADYISDIDPYYAYYHTDGTLTLIMSEQVIVQTPLGQHGDIVVTAPPAVVSNGLIEDITTVALAPLLRTHGIFMVHAFCASENGQALLLVGPSGSGKTTTGLNLIRSGWQFLSNDATMIFSKNGTVYAQLAPGLVNIHPDTFALLPQLETQFPAPLPSHESGKRHYAAAALSPFQAAEPQPLAAICILSRGDQQATEVQSLPKSVALAMLMSESVDQWDTPSLDAHIEILDQLTQQAAAFAVNVGRDLDAIPAALAALLPC